MKDLALTVEGAARGVTKSHDDNFRRGHAILDHIGVRMHEKLPGIRTTAGVPGKWLFLQELYQGGNPTPGHEPRLGVSELQYRQVLCRSVQRHGVYNSPTMLGPHGADSYGGRQFTALNLCLGFSQIGILRGCQLDRRLVGPQRAHPVAPWVARLQC